MEKGGLGAGIKARKITVQPRKQAWLLFCGTLSERSGLLCAWEAGGAEGQWDGSDGRLPGAEACFRKKDEPSTQLRPPPCLGSPQARGQPSFVPEEMSEPDLLDHFHFLRALKP